MYVTVLKAYQHETIFPPEDDNGETNDTPIIEYEPPPPPVPPF